MDAETISHLQGMEERLAARIEASEYRLEESLVARIEKTEAGLEERLLLHIEKSETNLLRAFHGWSRPMEMRKATDVVAGFDERLSLIEERVNQLERDKLN